MKVVADDDLGEPLLLHDVLGSNQEDPATGAARSIDWQEFMASLRKREQALRFINDGCPCGRHPIERQDQVDLDG